MGSTTKNIDPVFLQLRQEEKLLNFHTRVSRWLFYPLGGCYLYPTTGKCFQKPAMRIFLLSTAHGIFVQVAKTGMTFIENEEKVAVFFPIFPQ